MAGRVLTVLGTRPEIIRLSRLIPRLDTSCTHTVLYTGQNADPRLSTVFFDELAVRPADIVLECQRPGLGRQLACIFEGAADAIDRVRPDRVVILGDTNSGLAALVAARAGVPVVHLEAGNRCFSWASPEEVNRRAIDHVSTWLLPYTALSAGHLAREGITDDRIVVVGNPIFEVLTAHRDAIDRSGATGACGVHAGAFVLLTLHRAETVDVPHHLAEVLGAADAAGARLDVPVVFPVHPRTRERLSRSGGSMPERIHLVDPLGFADFVRLERDARLVLSDSGTVREECAILGTPCVVTRDYTERMETIESGASELGGRTRASLESAVSRALARASAPPHRPSMSSPTWQPRWSASSWGRCRPP
ncbi:MAG: UDP-N-acetylglucosamine 2-epimerase (non-hydrolyzing) [Vicinamibacterales bacterium]